MPESERDDARSAGLPTPATSFERCPEAERFQRDLYLYWRVARSAGGLSLSTRGALTKPALRRVRSLLAAVEGATPSGDPSEQEDERTYFLRRLLERLSLLKREPETSRLVAGPGADMERYLALMLTERLRLGARVWVAGGWWPESPDAKAEPPRLMVPASPRVALARKRLLDALAEITPGSEPPYPTTPAPGPSATSRSRRQSLSRPLRRMAETTTAGDEVTWRMALSGPLRWLGFVSPVDAEPNGARYQVTNAVLALRGEHGAPLADPSGSVTIQSDFSIVAFPPLHPRTLFTLDQVADALSLERTARYTLTRASFARARHAGFDAAAVMARLEALTSSQLAGNVAVTLADWGRASERAALHEGVCLLEVGDARVLDALLADRTAAQWIARRLTPTAALVVAEHLGRVRGWLLRRGECPAMRQL